MAILDSTIVNGDLSTNGTINATTITATSIKKIGGTSSQLLRADGGTTTNNFVARGTEGGGSGSPYGVAVGSNATASGNGSLAICKGTASANGAIAISNNSSICISDGSNSIAIGSGSSCSGYDSVAIGTSALCDSASSGRCVAIGSSAYCKGAYQSVAIGYGAQALYGASVGVGYNAVGPSTAAYTRVGGGYYTSAGRALMLGAGATAFTYMNAAGSSWTSASDIRDKTDIEEIDHALDFIMKIKPITYVMNNREDYVFKDENGKAILDENGKQQYDVEAHERGDKKKHRRFAGVSAQETYQALIDCYKDDNYAQIVDDNKYDNPDDEYLQQYTVSYERFVPFLIKAIQEQQEQIETLQARLDELENLTQDDSSEE